ncbi:hypothetical protein IEN85_21005 [Pelagicoccus sp. NFK12]|uniref:Lipoprotein n=1 Tax=Pelagicoccus enzymogenes TaxID=2773457 RepID=A0A927FCS6_9BACT|nr:hypothetical protein [Pelagicoccus enzymogenes]MBD5781991.1 hypothetical protein [Pelagicoccus enzymogenes]
MKPPLRFVALATIPLLACSLHAGFKIKKPAFGGGGGGAETSKEEFVEQWVATDFDKAHDTAFGNLTKNGAEKDKIEWGMEASLALRAAGEYQKSIDFFDRVDELILEHDAAAEVQVSKEAASLFSNLRALPYDGFFYERIMVSVYKGLNYLSLGDREAARVAFRQAYERQRDAVTQFEKKIANEQAALDKATDKKDKKNAEKMDKALQDERVQGALEEEYRRIKELAIYADYVNPFAVYLDGLYYMTNGVDATDWERAALSLRRVADMNAGHSDFVEQDVELIEKLLTEEISESDIPATVYVVFETGRSASRIQNDVKLPLGFLVPELNNISFPLPNLQENDNYDEHLTVQVGDTELTTQLICSMDSVIAKEFQNTNPSVVSRTIRTVGAKAWATDKASKKIGGQFGLAGSMLAGAGKKAFNKATNKADLRCWSALPKEFQSARLPLPEDATLTLTTAGGQTKTVELNADAQCQVVYVQTINKGDEPMIQTFDLL